MALSSIDGVIQRRLLVNFRAHPDVVSRLLPAPFEPRLVQGWGMVGICLIALDQVRPGNVPGMFGVRAENAAHRVAVEWQEGSLRRQGVFIPRRDTSSSLVQRLGGKLFPGAHHRGVFSVDEAAGLLTIKLRSADGETDCLVKGRTISGFPGGSVFASLEEASCFFEVGTIGYSPAAACNRIDALELSTAWWRVQPFEVSQVKSAFFDNPRLFPPASIAFDSALIMRDVPCRWTSRHEDQVSRPWAAGSSARPAATGPINAPSASS